MVNVGQKFNLNHIYYMRSTVGNLAVGEHAEVDHSEIVLFEKSLALTSDLKRLPVLRSINVAEIIARTAGANMQASGVNFALVHLFILNEELNVAELQAIWENDLWEDHEVIYSAECTIVQSAGVVTSHQLNESGWGFLGGILLFNTLTIAVITESATNVASAELPPVCVFDIFFEIDWVPVNKQQFEEFILENVYAKG